MDEWGDQKLENQVGWQWKEGGEAGNIGRDS